LSLFEAMSPELRGVLSASGAVSRMSVPGGRARPLMLICETINVCNSRCVFCAYEIQSRPKGIMDVDLFSRVVDEYTDMGGGCLSLTPMVGDVLLDYQLPRRIEILSQRRDVISPSFTTNLYALGHRTDEEVRQMLGCLDVLHISCYGLTAEENETITQKRLHATFLAQMRRLLALHDEVGGARLRIGFRLLEERTLEELRDFQIESYGRALAVSSASNTYNNWGNAMKGELPGSAHYAPARDNTTPCLQLAVALMVFWDGRVSACSCCDYDASRELVVGDLARETLLDAFNGPLSRALWQAHEAGRLPEVCRLCTFHLPLRALASDHIVLRDVQAFIGG
jgi:hypothetical protein